MFEIGATLREARARAGLDLSEIESATMIPARFLEALEQERFEQLPAGLYRRSFLREYAEFLGLGGETYVGEYELRIAPAEPEQPPFVSAPARPDLAVARLLDLLSPARILAAAAVVVAGVAVWHLAGSGGTRAASRPPAPVRAARPRTGRSRLTTALAAAARKPPPRAAPAALTLSAAHGPCWLLVQVGSSSGPIALERTLAQGETVRFGLRRRLWIRLGAPWNLEAAIGSRSVSSELPPGTSEVVATRAGIAPAPATTAPAPAQGTAAANAVQANTRGYELMLTGNYAAALPLLRTAVAGLTDPTNPVTFYANFNLGQTLVKLGRCGSAIPYLTKAAQLEPANREALDALDDARRC